jgi:hypothetical protein
MYNSVFALMSFFQLFSKNQGQAEKPRQGLGFILKSVATLLNRVFELCITD